MAMLHSVLAHSLPELDRSVCANNIFLIDHSGINLGGSKLELAD
jgi:hypothetical protein